MRRTEQDPMPCRFPIANSRSSRPTRPSSARPWSSSSGPMPDPGSTLCCRPQPTTAGAHWPIRSGVSPADNARSARSINWTTRTASSPRRSCAACTTPRPCPTRNKKADPTLAAPGLAHMIQAAGSGNVQALTLVSQMAEQMSKVGGDMARVAGAIRPMINGERDPDKLCARHGHPGPAAGAADPRRTRQTRPALTINRKPA